MKKFAIVVGIILLVILFIYGAIVLFNYCRQVRWEDFKKMHDYLNHNL